MAATIPLLVGCNTEGVHFMVIPAFSETTVADMAGHW